MLTHIKLDALTAGFISIFFVFVADMAIIIAALILLPTYMSAETLQLMLKTISIFLLALPPYVAARSAQNYALLHSVIIGFIQALIIIALMTQTSSWQGTQKDNIIDQMPLVGGSLLILSLIAGILARWMNQKDKAESHNLR